MKKTPLILLIVFSIGLVPILNAGKFNSNYIQNILGKNDESLDKEYLNSNKYSGSINEGIKTIKSKIHSTSNLTEDQPENSVSRFLEELRLKVDHEQDDIDFGSSVAFADNGETFIASYNNRGRWVNGVFIQGEIFLYERTSDGWNETRMTTKKELDYNHIFGSTVAISGDGNTFIASLRKPDNIDITDRSIIVFDRNDDGWVETTLTSADESKDFGRNAGISKDGNTIVVSSFTSFQMDGIDQVNVFKRNSSNWIETKITASDGQEVDSFGSSIAVSPDGNQIYIGAPSDDDKGENSGSVYAYSWHNDVWEESKITAFDADFGDAFGSALALSDDGNVLAVGANMDDYFSTKFGSVYILERTNDVWTQKKIFATDPEIADHFGSSISISADGNHMVIGTSWNTSTFSRSSLIDYSSVYFADRIDGVWKVSKIHPNDTIFYGILGTRVAMARNNRSFLVGLPSDCNGNSSDCSGTVYLFGIDSDKDGLSDLQEIYDYFTDPSACDTDMDGVADGDEIRNSTDPFDDCSFNISDISITVLSIDDCDEDGLNNMEESLLGTDPFNYDSDDDTLSDFEEINVCLTDPLDQDSDDDGVSDSEEKIDNTDPNDECSLVYTNINLEVFSVNDCDQDSLTNQEESDFGTDPTRNDTDGDGLDDWSELFTYVTDPRKPTLMVKVHDKFMIYGQKIPELSMLISGFIEGDGEEDIEAIPTLNTNANDTSDAGIYDIHASNGEAPGYEFLYLVGKLIIDKSDQIITFDDLDDVIILPGERIELEAISSSELEVGFVTEDQDLVKIDGNILTAKAGGQATVTAYQQGNNNFRPAMSVDRTIRIGLPLGLETMSNSFNIYPNPATHHFSVKGSFDQLLLYNLNGHYIKSFNQAIQYHEISDLKPGIYVVVKIYEDKFSTGKLYIK